MMDDLRVVVLLVDGQDIWPAALLHAIVGPLETCVEDELSALAQLPILILPASRAPSGAMVASHFQGPLTLPRENALADLAYHGEDVVSEDLAGELMGGTQS